MDRVFAHAPRSGIGIPTTGLGGPTRAMDAPSRSFVPLCRAIQYVGPKTLRTTRFCASRCQGTRHPPIARTEMVVPCGRPIALGAFLRASYAKGISEFT